MGLQRSVNNVKSWFFRKIRAATGTPMILARVDHIETVLAQLATEMGVLKRMIAESKTLLQEQISGLLPSAKEVGANATRSVEALEDLSSKGLFIVGNARSGTSIFAGCLNLSNDIYLLLEANVHVSFNEDGFIERYNAMHLSFKNDRKKGTYIPQAISSENGALPVLLRMAKRHRYVGEKIAFGPHGLYGGQTFQDVFFEFHCRYFYYSTYFLIIRNPSESVWSMSKLFPDKDIEYLFESWLRTINILIDCYQTFPNCYFLFSESFCSDTIKKIGQILGVHIPLPEGMVSDKYKTSLLKAGEVPACLSPHHVILDECNEIYSEVRSVMSADTFRFYGPDNQGSVFKHLKDRIASTLTKVVPGAMIV
jgi:hypothetical protein